MREILFRGRRIDNGEWAEGYYAKCRGQHYILPVYDSDHGFDERYSDWIEVDTQTVCQYTGLTDKNGRKIFEGDIIQFEKRKYVVVWIDGIASFNSKSLDDRRSRPSMNVGTMKVSEVIGNSFDNPSLIE